MRPPMWRVAVVDFNDKVLLMCPASADSQIATADAASVGNKMALSRLVQELIPDLLEENAHLIAHGQDVADLLELCVTSQFSLPGNHAH